MNKKKTHSISSPSSSSRRLITFSSRIMAIEVHLQACRAPLPHTFQIKCFMDVASGHVFVTNLKDVPTAPMRRLHRCAALRVRGKNAGSSIATCQAQTDLTYLASSRPCDISLDPELSSWPMNK